MKITILLFVQTVFLIAICSGQKRDDGSALSINKRRQNFKAEKELYRAHHDIPLTTESGKHRRTNFGGRKGHTNKDESRIKTRSAIKQAEETTTPNEKRKTRLKHQDAQEVLSTRRTKCPQKCVASKCLKVIASECPGSITKDLCGCCSICKSAKTEVNQTTRVTTTTTASTSISVGDLTGNACSKLVCPQFTECILNIQGIPVCRCPNMYACQSAPKDRVCSAEGRTYKNRCFLKIEECTRKQKIEVAHDGDCKGKKDLEVQNSTNETEKEDKLIKKPSKNRKNRTLVNTENKSKKSQNQRNLANKRPEADVKGDVYVSKQESDASTFKKQTKRAKNRKGTNLI